MTQFSAIIAPEGAPASDADCRVVLLTDGGAIADSAPVGLKTRATGSRLEITIDREVTLTAAGRMQGVEARGPRGQRYLWAELDLEMDTGDLVTVHPGW